MPLQLNVLLEAFFANHTMIQLVIVAGILMMELMLNNGEGSPGSKWTILALVLHAFVALIIFRHNLKSKQNYYYRNFRAYLETCHLTFQIFTPLIVLLLVPFFLPLFALVSPGKRKPMGRPRFFGTLTGG